MQLTDPAPTHHQLPPLPGDGSAAVDDALLQAAQWPATASHSGPPLHAPPAFTAGMDAVRGTTCSCCVPRIAARHGSALLAAAIMCCMLLGTQHIGITLADTSHCLQVFTGTFRGRRSVEVGDVASIPAGRVSANAGCRQRASRSAKPPAKVTASATATVRGLRLGRGALQGQLRAAAPPLDANLQGSDSQTVRDEPPLEAPPTMEASSPGELPAPAAAMAAAKGAMSQPEQPMSAEPAPATVARPMEPATVMQTPEEIMRGAAARERPQRSLALSDATLSLSPSQTGVAVGDSTAESQPPLTATPGTMAATPQLQATQQ